MPRQIKDSKENRGQSKKHLTLPGVCAVCPEIVFPERLFCHTGLSRRAKRSEIAKRIVELHGRYEDDLRSYTDYLLVGSGGNPAWAFCAYGRKVEGAVVLRKKGQRILIVHENDFWDAVEDAGVK